MKKKISYILSVLLTIAMLFSQGIVTASDLSDFDTFIDGDERPAVETPVYENASNEEEDDFDDDASQPVEKPDNNGSVDEDVSDLFGADNGPTGGTLAHEGSSAEGTSSTDSVDNSSSEGIPADSSSLDEVPASDTTSTDWGLIHFIVKGKTLYGFSREGIKQLAVDGNLVLPRFNQAGEQIENIASFAFVHNKNTQIDEYVVRPGENGAVTDTDVDGNKIEKLGEEFNETDIKSVTIPEGYKYIGSDAFAFNKKLSSVKLADSIEYISEYGLAHNALTAIKLPSELKKLGDQAFFDNRIKGEVILPAKFHTFGERSFKGNHIDNIVFAGDKVTEIPEQCFQDNRLTSLVIPKSIASIAPDAFSGNIGDEHHGYFVVLRTPDGTNPHNLPNNSVYINPTDDLKTEPLDLDYRNWDEKDFIFDGSIVKGFSQIGQLKVKRNRKLVIPVQNGDLPITEIAAEAFRNVDFDTHHLKKYDLESITLPATVEKIGDYAFQSNEITDFEAPESLKVIGKGAFMNNKINTLDLFSAINLELIDDAAFHINEIFAIVIPDTVKKIGISAFRANGADNVLFMGGGLEEIKEMAFRENSLTDVNMEELTKLKKIDVQAFIANKLESITLPPNLIEIAEEAFKINRLTNLNVPKSVKRIALNAFDENERVVEIEVEDHVNINKIPDGNNFIVNKNEATTSRTEIEAVIKKIEALRLDDLRFETKEQFLAMKKAGEALLAEENLREGEKLKYLFESNFFLARINLDKLIKKAAETMLRAGNEKHKNLLKEKLDYARQSYNNSGLTERKQQRLETELQFLTDLVNHVGAISSAKMLQGHYILESPLPIPPYHIGVNVYFDSKGKILYVLDMSYTIGAGQFDDNGNPILNVDEDNEGYHVLALDTLADYAGLFYRDILAKTVDTVGGISLVDERAMYHREGFYKAVQDATKDYAKMLQDEQSVHVGFPYPLPSEVNNTTRNEKNNSSVATVPATKPNTHIQAELVVKQPVNAVKPTQPKVSTVQPKSSEKSATNETKTAVTKEKVKDDKQVSKTEKTGVTATAVTKVAQPTALQPQVAVAESGSVTRYVILGAIVLVVLAGLGIWGLKRKL